MNLLPHRVTSDGPLPPCDDCGMTFLGPPGGECPVRLRAALDEAQRKPAPGTAERELEDARVQLDVPPSVSVASAIRELQERLGKAKAEIAKLNAEPRVHPLAMAYLLATRADKTAREWTDVSIVRSSFKVDWYEAGCPIYAPPIDPVGNWRTP